ncbi:unnamed protein product [Cyprideis torosa]|uniref:Transposase IS66 central domain-containing protein n=1 Tax=Cyprideis torosa TaxID=163714 RepID=A0A7R8WW51_9CRUS|nr:unnamed protein product [Cyprideis torosa]CAG0907082.1 unnamed protein product [Cyprideis torosa]
MKTLPQIPNIPEKEQTPLVKALLGLLEQQATHIVLLEETVAGLKDEINILKGEKKRPTFKPSKMDKSTNNASSGTKKKDKRGGSKKKSKNAQLIIHEDVTLSPSILVPPGSRFKGYRDFIVQDLIISSHNTRYRLERWITPEGDTLKADLPNELRGRHFGPELVRFILYQYHHCQTTQPLLLEQLREYGIDISVGQIEWILSKGHESLHAEKDTLLQAGLSSSSYVSVDDSGARHQGNNGYVTQIGNECFAWFKSTASKSRLNFLDILRAGHKDYCLSVDAIHYMEQQKLALVQVDKLRPRIGDQFENEALWLEYLHSVRIRSKRHIRIATEGALLGSLLSHGFCNNLVIVSDDAGQFNILQHALCWIHAERLVHKMLPLNESHREDIAHVRDQIWTFYADLKAFKNAPEEWDKKELARRFDQIFTHKTGFATLNQLLKRLHANKDELLKVLEHPEIPLHTNGSETDIRDYVKKRKVSGGTRSDEGQRCRDTFISLKKTCRKLGISFWDFLHDRLCSSEPVIPQLSELVRQRASAPAY